MDATFTGYDEQTPPPGPFYELTTAMSLLADGDKWDELVAASENHPLQLAAGEIEKVLRRKLEARLRAQ